MIQKTHLGRMKCNVALKYDLVHTHTSTLSSWSKTDCVVRFGGGAIMIVSGSLGSFFTIPKKKTTLNNSRSKFHICVSVLQNEET